MAIIRCEHHAHFTIVPNAVFGDTRLSVEAKGVLGYLLSRPHKWHVRLEHVARTPKIGVESCSGSSASGFAMPRPTGPIREPATRSVSPQADAG